MKVTSWDSRETYEVGLIFRNDSPATALYDQYAPLMRLLSPGWASSPSASRNTVWDIISAPEAGSANPLPVLKFRCGTNRDTPDSDILRLDSAGASLYGDFYPVNMYPSGKIECSDIDATGTLAIPASEDYDPVEGSIFADSAVPGLKVFSNGDWVTLEAAAAPPTPEFMGAYVLKVGATECDYTTIQAAVTACNGTDKVVILITPGVYDEDITIDVSNVCLYGFGPGISVIEGTLTINDNLSNLYFQGLTIDAGTSCLPSVIIGDPDVWTTAKPVNIHFNSCWFKNERTCNIYGRGHELIFQSCDFEVNYDGECVEDCLLVYGGKTTWTKVHAYVTVTNASTAQKCINSSSVNFVVTGGEIVGPAVLAYVDLTQANMYGASGREIRVVKDTLHFQVYANRTTFIDKLEIQFYTSTNAAGGTELGNPIPLTNVSSAYDWYNIFVDVPTPFAGTAKSAALVVSNGETFPNTWNNFYIDEMWLQRGKWGSHWLFGLRLDGEYTHITGNNYFRIRQYTSTTPKVGYRLGALMAIDAHVGISGGGSDGPHVSMASCHVFTHADYPGANQVTKHHLAVARGVVDVKIDSAVIYHRGTTTAGSHLWEELVMAPPYGRITCGKLAMQHEDVTSAAVVYEPAGSVVVADRQGTVASPGIRYGGFEHLYFDVGTVDVAVGAVELFSAAAAGGYRRHGGHWAIVGVEMTCTNSATAGHTLSVQCRIATALQTALVHTVGAGAGGAEARSTWYLANGVNYQFAPDQDMSFLFTAGAGAAFTNVRIQLIVEPRN